MRPAQPEGPTPADHLAAARRALALVALAERGDLEAFAAALSDAVSDPHDAGAVVYGLVELCRFAVGMAVPDPGLRLEVLEGLVVDTAREAGA